MRIAIVLTDQARTDLADIMDHIALDVPLRAEKHVDALLNKIRSLKRMPKRCPLAP